MFCILPGHVWVMEGRRNTAVGDHITNNGWPRRTDCSACVVEQSGDLKPGDDSPGTRFGLLDDHTVLAADVSQRNVVRVARTPI